MAELESSTDDVVAELGKLLRDAGVEPRLNRARIAPSTLYDAEYHIAVIACAMRINGERDGDTASRILAGWLKLLQFLASRPTLVEDFEEYIRTRRDGDLEKWGLMPRGYLGDRTHDAVVDLLVASGILSRAGDYIVGGQRYPVLVAIVTEVERANLFEGERKILEQLRGIRATKALLGGK